MLSSEGRRWILAATILVVGLLQAWDSDVLASGPIPWILAGAAILAAASAALIADLRAALFGTVLLSGALIIAARWISETPMPGLLVIPVAAGALLLINGHVERREAGEAGGRQPSAR